VTQPSPPDGTDSLTILSGSQMYRRAWLNGYDYAQWADRAGTDTDDGPRPDTTNPYDLAQEADRINEPRTDELGDALLVRSPSGRVVVAIYPGEPGPHRDVVKAELRHAIQALMDYHDTGVNQ
jgi:hypothetical protein